MENTDWRAIETAPKDGSFILVAANNFGKSVVGEAYWRDEPSAWWWANTDPGGPHDEAIYMSWNVTHWMPLPVAPAIAESEAA